MKDAKKGGNAKYGKKNLFDTTETHRKKTWLLSWPSSDSCFVLFFCNVFTEWPRWSDCFFPLV